MGVEENIRLKDSGVLLKLRISPNSSKNELFVDGEIIKLKITAQPIENKANKAVVEYLSKLFKIPKSSVTIVKGDTSKDKTIFLNNISSEKADDIKKIILSK